MSDYEFFGLETADGAVTITMNRPPLNVMNMAMMAEFNALLETTLGGADLSAVVIRAQGKAFSAGVDVADHTADKVAEMIHQFHGIFRKLASTDALTIAVVNGAALGGGCELACFCDIVLASDRAKFGQPEVQVGVFPPIAACVLPHKIGLGKAIEFAAVGMTVNASEAERMGLVNKVFASDGFDAQVDGYLKTIGKLSRPVVRLAKRATSLVAREEILNHLERAEKLYLEELMQLSDAHEGTAAFLERRPANWKHA